MRKDVIPWVFVTPFEVSRALPADLCPSLALAGAETLCESDDFGKSVRESVEARPSGTVRQGAAEHLHHMLSASQCVNDAGKTDSERGDCKAGLGRQVSALSAPVGIPV